MAQSVCMKTIEEVCCDVVREPKSVKNILIGLLLGLIPVVNFLSFGYLEKFGKQRDGSEAAIFPGWFSTVPERGKNLQKEFLNGAWVFLEFVLTIGVAMAICHAIFGLISREEFGVCVGLFVSAPAFACALVADVSANRKNIRWMLRNIGAAYKLAIVNYRKLLIPSILFLCLQITAFFIIPSFFMGAPLFLGFVFLIAYVKQILH
ncbi:MAG: hypothetical protein LBI81_00570 [Puniceicoccales bacterium]|nr:hypothetical protein [Puniceicoccales bacterium]